MADKQKLAIARWLVTERVADSGPRFEALLNPSSYAQSMQLNFTNGAKFSRQRPETLVLPKLLLDGTGVVPGPTGTQRSVPEQLQLLRDVLFLVKDKKRMVERPVVVVTWGPLYFLGRAESMGVEYVLFAPSGVPLRASVDLKLVAEVRARPRTQASVDAPRMVRQLRATAAPLPQLAFEAYDDPALDQSIARANGLTSIRNIAAGTILNFAKGA